MNTAKQELTERRQELTEKKRLSKVIGDWADKNKKVFWKYEVASFYKTYKLKITNLPEPSINDIQLSSINRLLNDQQKKQLCNAITKDCAKAMKFSDSTIDVKIDYVDGTVVAQLN